MNNKRGHGFSIVELIIAIVIIGILGALAWVFFTRPAATGTDSSGNTISYVEWGFNGTTWKPQATAPVCEEPLNFKLPVDSSKITSVLYPGQVRGGDFKPHGGLGADTNPNNTLAVSAPMDGFLYRGARYIEQGEVQYLFDFIHPCGIMYRLDHLKVLSGEFTDYANQLPEPKQDDSRTSGFNTHSFVKQGTLIASEVGIAKPLNPFFDLGVYDLRAPNEASKTELYQTNQLRISDKEQSFFAVCWLNLLQGEDKVTIANLPARGVEGKTSDYCK